MENGGREREQGAESDEEDNDDFQRNTSDSGRDASCQSANPGRVQLNELMDLVFRAGLDSKFQGLQRGPGVPEPGGVGRRTEWCTVAGIRLGQFHSVPAFLWVRRTAVTY